jgi:hypothetical protein
MVSQSFWVVPDTLIDEYYMLVLSFTLPPPFPTLMVMNFYHHITDHRPLLDPLLTCHIDPNQCLLLCGDFNMHLEMWSPADVCPSPWAPTLEQWIDNESLWSLVPEGAIMRRRGVHKAIPD